MIRSLVLFALATLLAGCSSLPIQPAQSALINKRNALISKNKNKIFKQLNNGSPLLLVIYHPGKNVGQLNYYQADSEISAAETAYRSDPHFGQRSEICITYRNASVAIAPEIETCSRVRARMTESKELAALQQESVALAREQRSTNMSVAEIGKKLKIALSRQADQAVGLDTSLEAIIIEDSKMEKIEKDISAFTSSVAALESAVKKSNTKMAKFNVSVNNQLNTLTKRIKAADK